MHSPIARLKSALPDMPPAARRLATVILDRPDAIVEMSIGDLAKAARVSEGSVIGLCQQMGAKGFPEFKIAIAREIGTSRELLHEDIERGDDSRTVIAKIAASHRMAIEDTMKVLDPVAVDRAVALLRDARRIEVYGIGTAAPIAEDAAYRFLRLGLDARAMVDSHSQAVSAAFTGPGITTITISHSGRTRETLMATRIARSAGARTICITNFGKPPLLRYSEVALFTAAVETRYRMEAMASRVAQLVVIDSLYARLALEAWGPSLEAIERSYAVLSEKRLKSGADTRQD